MSINYDLKVGFSCTNDCIHCVVKDKRKYKDLSFDEIKNILSNNKITNLTITGGEASLRKDFIEILKFAKDCGIGEIVLQTMARPLADLNLAKEASKYINLYLIAIHSHDSYIHDAITQKSNSWNETIRAIKNLQHVDASIQSQTVISSYNAISLYKTYQFIFDDLGIKYANLTYPHAMGAALENIDIVMPKYSLLKDEIHKIIKNYKNKIFIEAVPRCILYPYHDDIVRITDDVLTKNSKLKGFDASLNNKNVENYSKLILSDKIKIDSCSDCCFDSICVGVWKEYVEYYKNELDIFPIKEIK